MDVSVIFSCCTLNGQISLCTAVWVGFCVPFLQKHRMFGVGRDLCGSPSPTPCRSRVTHRRLHRTASRRVLNISREGDSTAPLGSLFLLVVVLDGIFQMKFLYWFSLGKLEEEEIRIELLMQKHASLSCQENCLWDADCCRVYGYGCIDPAPSNFLQILPPYFTKRKKRGSICVYIYLVFLFDCFTFILRSVTLSRVGCFCFHSLIAQLGIDAFRVILQWTSTGHLFHTKSTEWIILLSSLFLFSPQSSAYLYCLRHSLAVKFCRSSLSNLQAWVAVSFVQWTCPGCFYSSPVCCDNVFQYLLWYLFHLSGTTKGIVTDEAVVGVQTMW